MKKLDYYSVILTHEKIDERKMISDTQKLNKAIKKCVSNGDKSWSKLIEIPRFLVYHKA